MAPNQSGTADRSAANFSSGKATAIGIVAVGFWSALALLTELGGALPPFELLSLSFTVAFICSVILLALKGRKAFRAWRQPISAWGFSFVGIFTYHALYFFALSRAPAAEASLIAYLWPLLIVMIATLVDRSTFCLRHLVGAGLGFFGSALVILEPEKAFAGVEFPLAGYLAAAGCAIVWSTYSVLNRRFQAVPSDLIGGVCGLVAFAGMIAHLLFEQTVMPTAFQWLVISLLGAGPVGAAFFAWDHATKHGYLPLLGALSYLAPLFSTVLLLAAGLAPMSWSIVAAASLIVAGAVIASFGLPWQRRRTLLSEKT